MTLSDEQIQDLLHVGNPTDEERRLIRMGWKVAIEEMRAALEAAEKERDALRAKVEQMERQKPAPSVPRITERMLEEIERVAEHSYRRHFSGCRGQQVTPADAISWHIVYATREVLAAEAQAQAQPAPSLASSDVSLINDDKTQPAPSVPDGWLRAIDEALVTAHIGVANAHDTYEQAREKLANLIGWHVDVAIDPAVNGGWKLVPIEPTHKMLDAGEDTFVSSLSGTPTSSPIAVYRAMLAAAPEAKP